MPQLIPFDQSAEITLQSHLSATLRAGYTLERLEFVPGRPYLFAAVRHPDSRVRALVLTFELARILGRTYVALNAPVREERNPEAVDVSPALFKLLTPLGGLFADPDGAQTWRSRVRAYHLQLKGSQAGDVLLGDYGGPGDYGDDTLGYNAEGKERFRRDALRYLKRLQGLLGWTGKPYFNASGIAGSGDASLHLAAPDGQSGVYVTIGEGCPVPMVRHSKQGVQILWRFERPPQNGRQDVSQRNQWADWDISAAQLAERILNQYRPAVLPLARAGD